MVFQFFRTVSEIPQVISISQVISKKNVHQRTGDSAISTRFNTNKKISLFCGGVFVSVDNHNFCAPIFTRLERVCHDVNLRAGGVCAPNNDEVRLTHFTGIDPSQFSGAGNKTVPRERDTNSGVKS